MKRTITTFLMLICSVFAFAQQADDAVATNKWIETYENLNTAKDWNGMLSQAEACKAEIPNWEFVYYYEGLANFNLKNYNQAIPAFDKFIEKNTATPAAYLYRANSYLEIKEADFAIRDYDLYLQANPNDVAVMLNKAQARMIKKDFANYINDLTAVLALEPTNVAALSNRASAYAQQKNWQAVIADLTAAIAVEEKASFYYDRGFANYSMKTAESLQAAVADFTKAEEKGMKTEQLFNSRAVCNKALKNFAQEAEDYTKLIELNANNEKYFYNRGVALFKAEKLQEALNDFSKAIEMKPDYVNAYKYRANTYGKLGDKKSQAADAAKVKELQGPAK